MIRRVALVTGGARRIGAAICRALVGHGYAVVIHCNRSFEDAERLAGALASEGGRASIVRGDLERLETLDDFFARACLPFGPPDLLVNNASVFLDDSAASVTASSLAVHLAVNLEAPVLLSRAFAAALPCDETGAIVNILDQRVLRPNPQFLSYTLSKSALHTATKTLAQALAPRIRVNGIGPGPTLPNARDGAEGLGREAEGTLLGRVVAPADIAAAVVYLAGAGNVTGQMIAVDGGQHLGWKTPDVII